MSLNAILVDSTDYLLCRGQFYRMVKPLIGGQNDCEGNYMPVKIIIVDVKVII